MLPISAALILVYVTAFIAGIVLRQVDNAFGWGGGDLLDNLTAYAGIVFGWYIAVAIYDELKPQTNELEHIFT